MNDDNNPTETLVVVKKRGRPKKTASPNMTGISTATNAADGESVSPSIQNQNKPIKKTTKKPRPQMQATSLQQARITLPRFSDLAIESPDSVATTPTLLPTSRMDVDKDDTRLNNRRSRVHAHEQSPFSSLETKLSSKMMMGTLKSLYHDTLPSPQQSNRDLNDSSHDGSDNITLLDEQEFVVRKRGIDTRIKSSIIATKVSHTLGEHWVTVNDLMMQNGMKPVHCFNCSKELETDCIIVRAVGTYDEKRGIFGNLYGYFCKCACRNRYLYTLNPANYNALMLINSAADKYIHGLPIDESTSMAPPTSTMSRYGGFFSDDQYDAYNNISDDGASNIRELDNSIFISTPLLFKATSTKCNNNNTMQSEQTMEQGEQQQQQQPTDIEMAMAQDSQTSRIFVLPSEDDKNKGSNNVHIEIHGSEFDSIDSRADDLNSQYFIGDGNQKKHKTRVGGPLFDRAYTKN